MRVEIDGDRCSGHNMCSRTAPGVFLSDAEGFGYVVDPDVPPEHREAVRLAVANCPEAAIRISDTPTAEPR